MKLNPELNEKILLLVEETPLTDLPMDVKIKGYSDEEIAYHVHYLGDTGLIATVDTSTAGHPYWMAGALTSMGHQYLTEIHKREQATRE